LQEKVYKTVYQISVKRINSFIHSFKARVTDGRTETATVNRVDQLGLSLGYVVIAEASRQWRR